MFNDLGSELDKICTKISERICWMARRYTEKKHKPGKLLGNMDATRMTSMEVAERVNKPLKTVLAWVNDGLLGPMERGYFKRVNVDSFVDSAWSYNRTASYLRISRADLKALVETGEICVGCPLDSNCFDRKTVEAYEVNHRPAGERRRAVQRKADVQGKAVQRRAGPPQRFVEDCEEDALDDGLPYREESLTVFCSKVFQINEALRGCDPERGLERAEAMLAEFEAKLAASEARLAESEAKLAEVSAILSESVRLVDTGRAKAKSAKADSRAASGVRLRSAEQRAGLLERVEPIRRAKEQRRKEMYRKARDEAEKRQLVFALQSPPDRVSDGRRYNSATAKAFAATRNAKPEIMRRKHIARKARKLK